MRSLVGLIFGVAALVSLAACYPGLSGRVIDGGTQQPIAGAVVLVVWPETSISGKTTNEVHAYSETETHADGSFSLTGMFSPFASDPEILIYKRGYTAWRSDYIFPGNVRRMDYDNWENDYVYRLERMPPDFSLAQYLNFLRLGMFGFGREESWRFANILDEVRKDDGGVPGEGM